MSEKNSEKKKKPYQKPEIKIIELAAEEVLAIGCKTQTTPGSLPFGPTCLLAGCGGIGS